MCWGGENGNSSPGWGCNSDNFSKTSPAPPLCNLSVQPTRRGRNPGVAAASRSSAAVFCFEGYWPNMSEEITLCPHLAAFLSSLRSPTLSVLQPACKPHGARRRFCWWMLKAAPVPQQLTPLLQDAACQLDGISRLLLPVTQHRRGTQCLLRVFASLFCLQWRAGQAMSYKGGRGIK